eukprot:7857858-Pyramimonas_sp.AAC.1
MRRSSRYRSSVSTARGWTMRGRWRFGMDCSHSSAHAAAWAQATGCMSGDLRQGALRDYSA